MKHSRFSLMRIEIYHEYSYQKCFQKKINKILGVIDHFMIDDSSRDLNDNSKKKYIERLQYHLDDLYHFENQYDWPDTSFSMI